MLVLARLSRARADGYPVLALIRGSAIGQDGATDVLTAPSGPAQQRVIRAALVDAGLHAADVDVIEAHGTGTKIGDPIEAKALQATYGKAHSSVRPLLVGLGEVEHRPHSVRGGRRRSDKDRAVIRNGVVPATLHLDSPTPQVDWPRGRSRWSVARVAWPDRAGRPRRAGVSAFGLSGTNAHLILEQAPSESAV